MSSSFQVTSNITVVPSISPNPVIYQYTNPEIIFSNLIVDYLNKIGFNDLLPNFRGVRVGADRPFDMLLYDDETGRNDDFNMLPAITIKDSSSSETLDTLSIGYEVQKVDAAYVTYMAGQIFNPSTNRGFLVTSSQNLTALQNATSSGQILSGISRWMTQSHTVELQIWADNKNITSLIYDAVNTFFLSYMDTLHPMGIDFVSISGRRSEQFDTTYGRLLWGASITFDCFIRIRTLEVNLETVNLTSINVEPTFETAS